MPNPLNTHRTDPNVLCDIEVEALKDLGGKITFCLKCNYNFSPPHSEFGLPCQTDRNEAVRLMKRYLEIHGYTVTNNFR